MAAPILPVINIPVDYAEEKEKITNFLRHYKGAVPALPKPSASAGALNGLAAPLRTQDDEDEDDLDAEFDIDFDDDEFDDMDVGDTDAGAGGRLAAGVQTRNAQRNRLKYMEQMQRIANREQDLLIIDLADVSKHRNTVSNESSAPLVAAIMANARRYVDLFYECVDAEMPPPTRDISHKDDVLDVIMHQRRERNARAAADAQGGVTGGTEGADGAPEQDEEAPFPPMLLRRYTLYIKPFSPKVEAPLAVRTVRGAHLGKLITVRGIVTRVSEVKPFLLVDAYACDACGAEIFQEVTSRSYMPLTTCSSQRCKTNQTKGQLFSQTRASKFVPFQEVKVQEMADQVPVGHIPRSMTVHVYGPLVRSMNPGDIVHLGGIFLPMPYVGFRAIRAGLLTDTYLEAQHVHQVKKQYNELELTPEIEERIARLKQDPALYAKLAASIAPEIYGHEDVKKVLLLLLVGGVTKVMGDGMKIRGDINVCLMGDPGVAKSQLLKYISKVAPRGVYTTGRGSSGVGLTAAVMRDPVTEEMVLEGGALVLADNGIACIDEFDKMEEGDRTAIHEVMEQQTISISKAGITTTLNARTSILAAANPLYGRYNPRISPVDNINLPAALLSRFDILFLILDTPSRLDDERLAQHVTYVHMHNAHPPLSADAREDTLDPTLMRHYIALARQKRPTVPRAVSDYVVGAYVQLRAQHKEDEAREMGYTYMSARALLAILRLSQALARLRFADVVEIPDVDEALRLMDVSKASLHADRAGGPGGRRDGEHGGVGVADQSYVSKIYRIIREMAMAAGAARDEARRSRRAGAGAGSKSRLGRGPEGERGGDAMELDEDDDGLLDADAAADEEDDEKVGGPADLLVREVRDRIIASGWVEDQLQDCLNAYEELGVWQISETGGRLQFL
ncbi:DNA replication licensing factor MCM7 [Tilletia horrida]|nr:DNA replication licensing factor MCM7 [Tilletia horrida]